MVVNMWGPYSKCSAGQFILCVVGKQRSEVLEEVAVLCDFALKLILVGMVSMLLTATPLCPICVCPTQ